MSKDKNYSCHSFTLERYFDDLKKTRKLSPEEEKELGIRIQEGDEQALNTLVEHNLKFVVSYVKKLKDRYNIPFEELISEANVGLIRAAKKFNPHRGIKFISYAVWWVRSAINEYVEKYYDNNQILLETNEDLVRAANKNEINDNINESFEQQMHELQSTRATISELVKCLEDREKRIIVMFFGLNNEKERNLREISEELSLTEERVRQIKDCAIVKMRCEALMSTNIDVF